MHTLISQYVDIYLFHIHNVQLLFRSEIDVTVSNSALEGINNNNGGAVEPTSLKASSMWSICGIIRMLTKAFIKKAVESALSKFQYGDECNDVCE